MRLHPDRLQLVLSVVDGLEPAALAVARVAELERLTEALGLVQATPNPNPNPSPNPNPNPTPNPNPNPHPHPNLVQAAHRDAVYAAVAWRALRASERRGALGLTLELVSSGHPPAWELCAELCGEGAAPAEAVVGTAAAAGTEAAGEAALLDAASRGRLLAHALAHCPPERLGALLARWREWRAREAGRATASAAEDYGAAVAELCGSEEAEGAAAATAAAAVGNEAAEAAEATEALAAAAKGQHGPLLRLLTARAAAARPSGSLQEEGERAVAEAEARRWCLSSGAALEAAAEEEAMATGAEEEAGAGGAGSVAAAVAVREALLLGAARREPGSALALTLDRPCGARLRGAARAVERRLREAAAEDDVAAAQETCELGVRCYGALLCCYATGATPTAARRALGAPTEAALLALVPPPIAEEADGGGVADGRREHLEEEHRQRAAHGRGVRRTHGAQK